MAQDLMVDGGFEAGPGSGNWSEASTNFGTPICDSSCLSPGALFGPYAGSYFFWGGGLVGAVEDASVAQNVVIGPGTATLEFRFEIPACDGFGFDAFQVTIDGTQIFFADDLDASCGVTSYVQKSLNVSAWANGGAHTILFQSITDSILAPTDFLVDNVRLVGCP